MTANQSPVRKRVRDLERSARRLETWLRCHLADSQDLQLVDVSMPESAGIANETLTILTEGGSSGPRRFVVRVDTPDHLFLGMNLNLHYDMYAALADHPGIRVPAVLGFEEDRGVLGERFFVMEFVEGQIPPDRPNFNTAGWLKELSADDQRSIWTNAITMMSVFHALDASEFSFLQRPEHGASGLEQEMRHWFEYADACHAGTHDILKAAMQWLEEELPACPSTGLSWGDARLQNMIFRGTECVAMLDWDMVSLAGPEADLAWWALADHKYTYSKGLDRLPGIGSPARTISLWENLTGRVALNMDWHLVFAAFRQALVSIRLAQLNAKMLGRPAQAEPTIPSSAGLQWLSCLLQIPLGEPLTLPFVGLDR